MHLSDYVKQNGVKKTAQELGVTAPAITKAIRCNRNIVISEEDGKLVAKDIRRFPTPKAIR